MSGKLFERADLLSLADFLALQERVLNSFEAEAGMAGNARVKGEIIAWRTVLFYDNHVVLCLIILLQRSQVASRYVLPMRHHFKLAFAHSAS